MSSMLTRPSELASIARALQRLRGLIRGDQLPAEAPQPLGEVDQSRRVMNRQQRPHLGLLSQLYLFAAGRNVDHLTDPQRARHQRLHPACRVGRRGEHEAQAPC